LDKLAKFYMYMIVAYLCNCIWIQCDVYRFLLWCIHPEIG